MLRNGTLALLLKENPNVEHIMLHNIDTLGADVSPDAIGHHITHTNALTFEVIPRRIEDRGLGQEDIYPVAQIEKLWGI